MPKFKVLTKYKQLTLFMVLLVASVSLMTPPVLAESKCGAEPSVNTRIDLGCKGLGNPIIDLTFAIIRFLSVGVGIVVVGSVIVAGIQYTSSAGDPQATSKALKRIASTVSALILYIFIFALLNWLIPAGLLK